MLADGGERRPYPYSHFCEKYRRFEAKVDLVMRQDHRAGEELSIDYSGKRRDWRGREGRALRRGGGISNYTYVEATRTQKLADFVMSTIRALEYFARPAAQRGVGPDRHDPEINPTYAEMAAHQHLARLRTAHVDKIKFRGSRGERRPCRTAGS